MDTLKIQSDKPPVKEITSNYIDPEYVAEVAAQHFAAVAGTRYLKLNVLQYEHFVQQPIIVIPETDVQ